MEKTRIIDSADTYEAVGPDNIETIGVPFHDVGMALPAGTELLDGKFVIDRQIGAGGFGITYLARDIFLDRNVVIKECFPEAFCLRLDTQVHVNSPRHEAQHRKTVDMFMREARSIAKLRHPNIVGVHHVFEENETAYMVLELIHGRDLLDIIEDGEDPLHPDQIHEILVKTLDAIALVHRNDLLHRDISPDNILLDKWGSPVLIDFGAAREEVSKKADAKSTMLVVKDGYSPHEFYIAGSVQQPCSDLYALGATMYHLISGEAPVDSQTRVAHLASQGKDLYNPLVGRFPQYEIAFLEAIDTSLRLAPLERIQSATDWLDLVQTDAKKVKIVKIPDAKNLSKTLSELISETNAAVKSAPLIPAPDPVALNRRASDKPARPAWVDEFNRETSEAEARKQAEVRAAAEAARQAELAKLAAAQKEALERAKIEELRLKAEEDARKSRGLLNWIPMGRST
jgi:serine/threonine protein kinase